MKRNNTGQQTAAAGLFKLLLNPNVSQSGTQKKSQQCCSLGMNLSFLYFREVSLFSTQDLSFVV